jgi:hypothetical protein
MSWISFWWRQATWMERMTSRRELTRLTLLDANSLWYAFLGTGRMFLMSSGFKYFRNESFFPFSP